MQRDHKEGRCEAQISKHCRCFQGPRSYPRRVRLMVQTRRLKVAAETEGGIRLFKRADVEKVLARREAERKRLNQWTHVRTDADA